MIIETTCACPIMAMGWQLAISVDLAQIGRKIDVICLTLCVRCLQQWRIEEAESHAPWEFQIDRLVIMHMRVLEYFESRSRNMRVFGGWFVWWSHTVVYGTEDKGVAPTRHTVSLLPEICHLLLDRCNLNFKADLLLPPHVRVE